MIQSDAGVYRQLAIARNDRPKDSWLSALFLGRATVFYPFFWDRVDW